MNKLSGLFRKKLKVVNMGIESFSDSVKLQNGKVIHVRWRPPAGGNKRLRDILSKLR